MTGDARFRDLYDRYYGHVYAFCRRRLRPDVVEDAVADTFMTVWRRINDVPDAESALLWIYRVAYRVVGHSWRGARRAQRLSTKLTAIGAESHQGAEELVIMSQEESRALEAASRLPAKDREVLRLSIWEGLTNQEIGEVLAIGDNAVRQRLHRAKKSLTLEYNRLERRGKKFRAAQEGGAW